MKKLIKYISIACLGIISLNSCSDDDTVLTLDNASFVAPVIKTTTSEIVLAEDKQDQTALIFEWAAASYGVATTPNYSLEISSDSFKTAKELTKTQATTYEANTKDFNAFLVDILGLNPDTKSTIQYRVVSTLGTQGAEKIVSEVKNLIVTPFSTDLSTPWGVVGSITGWGGSADIPFWKTTKQNEFVAYLVGLKAGDEIKFRKDSNWDVNYGGTNITTTSTGFTGGLKAGGDNIVVPNAGNYKVVFDLTNLTFTAEKFQWGLVGSGTTNGWDGPDTDALSFDGIKEVWYGRVTLKDGEIKIRQNNAWDLNYGGANGKLVAKGDNIKVSAGTYDIEVSFKDLTYKLTPVK